MSVRNIVDGRFVLLPDDSQISEQNLVELERSLKVRAGDVLLAIVGATLGKAAIVELGMPRFAIQRSLAVFRPNPDCLLSAYLRYVFESPSFQDGLWSRVGFSAQPGIYLGTVASIKVPVPSLRQQHQIVVALDARLARGDAACSVIQAQVASLEERRQALITAAVTGQLDVSQAAA